MTRPLDLGWTSKRYPDPVKRRTRRPFKDDPHGDFDDIGCSHVEREYRYAQAKRKGNFTFTRY